jgi:hypothetical protein
VHSRKSWASYAPDLRNKKDLLDQGSNFGTKFLQTVWKRQRIKDRQWVGGGLVFSISRQNLLLTSHELPERS